MLQKTIYNNKLRSWRVIQCDFACRISSLLLYKNWFWPKVVVGQEAFFPLNFIKAPYSLKLVIKFSGIKTKNFLCSMMSSTFSFLSYSASPRDSSQSKIIRFTLGQKKSSRLAFLHLLQSMNNPFAIFLDACVGFMLNIFTSLFVTRHLKSSWNVQVLDQS